MSGPLRVETLICGTCGMNLVGKETPIDKVREVFGTEEKIDHEREPRA